MAMIALIWFVWVMHQFVVLILLLNFLIAIVSQSYENVMQKTDFFIYNQRLELNRETILLLDVMGRLRNFNSLVIATLSDETRADEDGAEWKGLVTNMKDYFAKIMKNQKIFLDQKLQSQNDKVTEVEKAVATVTKQLETSFQLIDAKIDKLTALLQKEEN
jgi:hypothetical protein